MNNKKCKTLYEERYHKWETKVFQISLFIDRFKAAIEVHISATEQRLESKIPQNH